MEINVENNKVFIMENGVEVAKATCYYDNTPRINGKRIGTIGEFETNNKENGIAILRKCEEIFKEKNVKLIVAPMNGNTWNKYRTLKYSNGEPLFLLENVNPIEHNEILQKAGFKELHTYTSTKGDLKDAYDSKSLDRVEQSLIKENIVIRKFDKENYIEDLRKIYNISVKSFSRNPFYTEIAEEEFLKQYEKYINLADEDFILIAEKDGNAIRIYFLYTRFK